MRYARDGRGGDDRPFLFSDESHTFYLFHESAVNFFV